MKQFHKFSLTFLLIFTLLSTLKSQQTNLWRLADESMVNKSLISSASMPTVYQIYELNNSAFIASMIGAPSERTSDFSRSNLIVTFPTTNGNTEQFKVLETPVMAPELAAKYPGISSYTGKGIQDPSAVVRFDVSSEGTNAMIMSGNRPTIYIDHINGNFYRVSSRDHFDVHRRFNCLTDAFSTNTATTLARPGDASQPILRTFRLALQSGAEFSLHFVLPADVTDAQKKARVLIAQNAQMTRANGVFERDFSVRLVLIPNNDTIIFLVAASDPIANPSSPSNTACQTSINNRVGNANYDIGHTESKGSDNGNAGCIGCVCSNGSKGLGWTVYSNPSLLDYYVIDYMTHEMGHQMGANHTFSFQTEGTGVNVEPGSGITIMGYAGITGSTDVAPHSIDNFHAKSIEQVTSYTIFGTGNSCATQIQTGNLIPTASAGSDYIIPKSTPFALTGVGADGDATDTISYCWEQIDNRTSGSAFPAATATTGPMFRPYSPTTNPIHIFPQLPYILTGANGFQWEILPSVARPLNFRLTVRDNHPIGGGTASDNMIVTVNGTAGPFGVSAPNTVVSWQGSTTQNVTWTVNGSDLAPVSCANVKISLSTDGGYTFPTVLVASTPNDGTESITVPNTPSTTARIKVESVGNIFFDISNTNFTITAPANGFSFTPSAGANINCGATATATATLATTVQGTFSTPINLTSTGAPVGSTVSFSPNPLTPGASTTVSLTNSNNIAPGTYNINVTGTAGTAIQNTVVSFVVAPGSGPSFTAQPTDAVVCNGSSVTFSSATTGTGISYQWQLSTNGGTTYTNITTATAADYSIASCIPSQNNNKYRIVATTLCGSTTSTVATLTVNSSPAISTSPSSVTACIGGSNTFTVAATGSGLNYQWQLSTDGGATYSNIGTNASSYTLSGITLADNNNQYQVTVTGICPGSATSTASILTVGTAPSFTTQPSDVTICDGTATNFTSLASGSGLSYQWQVSTDGGANYNNVTGATNPIYSVNSTNALNGNKYRVIVSSSSCATPTTSNEALLTVNALPAISTQPLSNTLCAGSNTTFTSGATGTNITYQWQLSTNGGVSFNDINGETNPTLTLLNITASQNGYQYHLLVNGVCTPAATSIPATLNVVSPVSVTAQPANVTVCDGSTASLAVAGSGTGVIYQWQVSTDGGASYNNVTGATSANYTFTATAANAGNLYHALLSNSTCPAQATSTAAGLIINPLPTVSATSDATNVCTGSPVTLTGAGASTYSWNPGGLTGQNVTVNPTVNPNTPELPNTVVYTVFGTDNNNCTSSFDISVIANPLPVVTLIATPANVSLIPGRTVTLTATVTPSTGFTLVWRKDGVVITNNSNSLVVDVQGIGSYTVEARGSGSCNRTSDAINISDSASNIVFIYPNPNNGNFIVSFYHTMVNSNLINKSNLTVFDSKGARVYQKIFDLSQGYNLLNVNLKNASSGVYMVELKDGLGNRIATGKVLVKP